MPWHFAFYLHGGSWRWHNVKSRLLGIGFLAMGALHFLVGVIRLVIDLHTRPSDGSSPLFGLVFVASGLASAGIGWWLCRRPTYRPDLGDVHPLLGTSEGYNKQHLAERGPRNWWTGDPVATKSFNHDTSNDPNPPPVR